jgi:acyl-CoA synthetase (AMP-forming)/AMP-acid ligase II
MTTVPTSLVDILQWRAKHQPDRLAYRFLEDGEFAEVVWTYKELDQRARSVGALLQRTAKEGERALLLFPPGLDFIAAFFGCLYAKVIAVPAYPPHPARLEKALPSILRIAADSRPSVVLLTGILLDAINSLNVQTTFSNSKLLVTDNADITGWVNRWQAPAIDRHGLAFLQYTSGSTTTPKGVRISHNNLLHNLGCIEKNFGQSDTGHAVIWLPPYHDMGLIGGILQPLYTGYPVTLLPHLLFLQRPFRWLQAISRFQATTSGGPDFAYDLCVRKIKPEQRELLDLRSWQVAFNGAEPVQYNTMVQFADYFALCGFTQEAFLPCYGLAESTLLVTGGPRKRPIVKQCLTKAGLAQNKVIPATEDSDETAILVSCGKSPQDQIIQIVDPQTGSPCRPDEIGEIWILSNSVADGYWNNREETETHFGARLSNGEDEPYLRTGDLGFQKEGELYLTGRLKNLLISEGKNHYPHDLERTVESAHPAILPAGSAVFSLNEGPERIVVVAEIKREQDVKATDVVRAIRSALSDGHGLHVDEIRLTSPGGVPKTTSGKKKHFLCREQYLAGTLKEIH